MEIQCGAIVDVDDVVRAQMTAQKEDAEREERKAQAGQRAARPNTSQLRTTPRPTHKKTRNEHLLHAPEHARLRHIRHVDEDVIRGVTVQRRAQALLVKMMTNEPNAAPEHEQPIQRADLDVFVRLLRRERARVAQQVHEAHRNTTVDVQDELVIDSTHRQHKQIRWGSRRTVSFLAVVTFSTASA